MFGCQLLCVEAELDAFKIKSLGYFFSAASVCLLAYAASVERGAAQTYELVLSVCLSLTGMFLRWYADHRAERARARQLRAAGRTARPARHGSVPAVS